MKDKINHRKYFVGNKKLKHVKLFESFVNEANEAESSLIKKLPKSIKNVKDVERLVLTLATEGLIFHFDDDPMDLVGEPFSKEEAMAVDNLLNQAFGVCEKEFGKNGFWEGFIKNVFMGYISFGTGDTVYVVKGAGGSGNVKKTTLDDYNKIMSDDTDETTIDKWFKNLKAYSKLHESEETNSQIRGHMSQFGTSVDDYVGKFEVDEDVTLDTFAAGPLKLKAGDQITVAHGKMPLCFSVKHPRGISEVKMIDMMNAQDQGHIFDPESNVLKYDLSDGTVLEVAEMNGPGMAGEPMTMVTLKVSDKIVRFDDVKSKMDAKDAKELQTYLSDVAAGNAASARSQTE